MRKVREADARGGQSGDVPQLSRQAQAMAMLTVEQRLQKIAASIPDTIDPDLTSTLLLLVNELALLHQRIDIADGSG